MDARLLGLGRGAQKISSGSAERIATCPRAGHTFPATGARTEEGWRWVPGYYAPEQQAESPQYVPEPPASLDVGPTVPAPDEGELLQSGNWLLNGGDYYWRPGYWAPYRPGFVWNSPRYLWSPGGWIFCNGYWDYPFNRRGLLFAPLALSGGWGPGWSISPALRGRGLLDGLFWRPGRPFYYYGSYFGPNYARQGFRPWFNGPWRADPVVGHYRWQNRDNPGWLAGMQRSYQNIGPGQVAPRITSIANLGGNDIRLSRQSTQQLARQTANVQAFRQAAEQRSRVETRAKAVGKGSPPRVANVPVRPSGSAPVRSGPPRQDGPGRPGNQMKQGVNNGSGPRVANAPARPSAAAPSVRSGPPRQDAPSRPGNQVKQGSNNQSSAGVRKAEPVTRSSTASKPASPPRPQFAESQRPTPRPAAVPQQAQPRSNVARSTNDRAYSSRPATSQPTYQSRPSSTMGRSPVTSSYRPSTPSYRPSTSAYRASPSFSRPSGGSFGGRSAPSFGGRGGGRR